MRDTHWEKMNITTDTAKRFRGTHQAWIRVMDGRHIFTVRPVNDIPSDNDGGYYSFKAALEVKGM